ncbi:hypothetical protein PHLCEN_2v6451 [Hermanssonia centrifuga]|uniref:Uncharacterized protein n=1 Tax=Hermanssonia centrifuga TaxID=98765 RepID=A0A2R6NZ49_9APHY|nr:hypothetical protein PHLCEN_2v6451 [Hermanssonia centrifuga]
MTKDELTFTSEGILVAKTADRSGDRSIAQSDWFIAADEAEKAIRKYHAADRGEAIAAHHANVRNLNCTHGWSIACEYDIQQRELWAGNPQHDVGVLHVGLLTQITTNIPPAASIIPATTSTPAAFVPQQTTAQLPARPQPDPRKVVTPLDPDLVEAKLRELNLLVEWQHVVDGLRSGFDVGATAPIPQSLQFKNHSSSELALEFIDDYIAQEQAAGRYSQAFAPSDLEGIIGCFRTSPLGLVPKPNSTKYRLVQDMSFPRNNPSTVSVNATINSDDFPTEWGTFTQTSELLLSLPPGSVAATFDITAAYRITPVSPTQQNALCVFWRGKVYVDRAVAFGLRSSAGVFGALADMLVAIYRASGFGPLTKWVDDFLVIRTPDQSWTEDEFIELTARLGVPWGKDKTRPLATRQRYIGFIWDLASKLVCLPQEKLTSILQLLETWLKSPSSFSAAEAAHLHGKLIHISCIFPLVRPFLPSISQFARLFRSPRSKLHPPAAVQADLTWVRYLVEKLPNEMPLSSPEPLDINWWGDASTSFGVGVIVGEFWGVWQWAQGFTVGPHRDFDIGWAEAVAVELGLQMAIHHGLINLRAPERNSILVRSDNSGVVTVVNKGRSRSRNTNKVLKHIYRLCADHRIHLAAQHVPGRDNISDALSRGDVAAFLAAFPAISRQTSMSLPPHLVPYLTL